MIKKLTDLKRNKYVIEGLKSSGIRYVFFFTNFIAQIVLVRLLNPEYFGTIAIVLAIIGMIEVFLGFSISMGYIHYDETKTLYNSAIVLAIINWVVFLFVTILMYLPLEYFYDEEVAIFVLMIAFFKIFYFINQVQLAFLEKKLYFTVSSLIVGLSGLLSICIAIGFAYLGFEKYSLLLRELVGSMIGTLLFSLFSKQKARVVYYDKSEIKKIFDYSKKMIVSRGAELIYQKLPFVYMGYMLDKHTIGMISQMVYLSRVYNQMVGMIVQKISFVFFSNNKNNKNNKKTFYKLIILNLFLGTPVVLIFTFYPFELLQLLWGSKWTSGAEYLATLGVFAYLLPIVGNYKSYIYANNLHYIVSASFLLATTFYFTLLDSSEKISYTQNFSFSTIFMIVVFFLLSKYQYSYKSNQT